MYRDILFIIAAIAASARSFPIISQKKSKIFRKSYTILHADAALYPFGRNHPFIEPTKIDSIRTKECAEEFGKCSLKEVKQLKDALHNERIRTYAFGNPDQITPEELTEHKIFEEELSLQLSLLESETKPNKSLFPEMIDVDNMIESPRVAVGTIPVEQQSMQQKHEKDPLLFYETFFMEENMIETVAFCLFIALLMIAPKLVI